MSASTRNALVIATLSAIAGRARPARAQLNLAEAVCQVRAARNVVATMSRRYAKCLLKCAQHAGSPAAAAAQCPMANACLGGLADPNCRCYDRAFSVAIEHEVDGCLDCPECYVDGGGNPNPTCAPDAQAKSDAVAAWSEQLFLSGSPAIFCDDSGSGDGLTVAESKCQQSVAKTLAAFSRKTARCYADCRNAAVATAPEPACDAPILTNPAPDSKTLLCVQRAQAQAALRIDKQCGAAGENRPECHGSILGAGWVNLEQGFVDGQDASYYCGD
jgi:hypothetical protein